MYDVPSANMARAQCLTGTGGNDANSMPNAVSTGQTPRTVGNAQFLRCFSASLLLFKRIASAPCDLHTVSHVQIWKQHFSRGTIPWRKPGRPCTAEAAFHMYKEWSRNIMKYPISSNGESNGAMSHLAVQTETDISKTANKIKAPWSTFGCGMSHDSCCFDNIHFEFLLKILGLFLVLLL